MVIGAVNLSEKTHHLRVMDGVEIAGAGKPAPLGDSMGFTPQLAVCVALSWLNPRPFDKDALFLLNYNHK